MKKISVFFISTLLTLPAYANEWSEKYLPGFVVYAGYGFDTGFNGSIGYRPFIDFGNKIVKTVTFRADFNYLNAFGIPQSAINDIIHKRTDTSLDFAKGSAHFQHTSFGILADVFPFHEIFRITGGFYYNNSKINGWTDIGGTVEIGKRTYNVPAGYSINGTVDFSRSFAPYIGLGIDYNVYENLYVTFDMGAIWNSEPDVSLSLSGPSGFYIDPSDLQSEEEWIASKVDVVRVIPLIKIGLAYKF